MQFNFTEYTVIKSKIFFGENYNSEKTIKKIATIFAYSGFVFAILAVLTAFILLVTAIDMIEDMVWLPIVIVLGGAVVGCGLIIPAHLIWGFGELIENTKNNSKNNSN